MRTAAPVARRVVQVMGLPVSLALRGRHRDDAATDSVWDAVVSSLCDADRVFSTYRPDSFVSRLARGELTLDDCPPEVTEVLTLGERARVESGGAFDVRHAGRDGAPVLDPSGVVKGWAVQRASAFLDGLDETDWCLNAGGDLVGRVHSTEDPAWRVGIEDPRDPSRILARVEVRDQAMATSSASHRGEHIVDARTGRPPTAVASVSVIADDLIWADIDATAAFAQGADALSWLQSRPGRSGLVVWADGRCATFAT